MDAALAPGLGLWGLGGGVSVVAEGEDLGACGLGEGQSAAADEAGD